VFRGDRAWLALVADDDGAVLRSDDHGENWERISGDPLFLSGFTDRETGWAVTAPISKAPVRAARVTHDGGRSWEATALPEGDVEGLLPPAPLGLAAVHVGADLVCYETADGGRSWARTGATAAGPVRIVSPREILVTRDRGAAQRSVDGCRTWRAFVRD
jgi:photosystem II stability/assembly factor-like uncharacterized protein